MAITTFSQEWLVKRFSNGPAQIPARHFEARDIIVLEEEGKRIIRVTNTNLIALNRFQEEMMLERIFPGYGNMAISTHSYGLMGIEYKADIRGDLVLW